MAGEASNTLLLLYDLKLYYYIIILLYYMIKLLYYYLIILLYYYITILLYYYIIIIQRAAELRTRHRAYF